MKQQPDIVQACFLDTMREELLAQLKHEASCFKNYSRTRKRLTAKFYNKGKEHAMYRAIDIVLKHMGGK